MPQAYPLTSEAAGVRLHVRQDVAGDVPPAGARGRARRSPLVRVRPRARHRRGRLRDGRGSHHERPRGPRRPDRHARRRGRRRVHCSPSAYRDAAACRAPVRRQPHRFRPPVCACVRVCKCGFRSPVVALTWCHQQLRLPPNPPEVSASAWVSASPPSVCLLSLSLSLFLSLSCVGSIGAIAIAYVPMSRVLHSAWCERTASRELAVVSTHTTQRSETRVRRTIRLCPSDDACFDESLGRYFIRFSFFFYILKSKNASVL